jgi:hypothetical protein
MALSTYSMPPGARALSVGPRPVTWLNPKTKLEYNTNARPKSTAPKKTKNEEAYRNSKIQDPVVNIYCCQGPDGYTTLFNTNDKRGFARTVEHVDKRGSTKATVVKTPRGCRKIFEGKDNHGNRQKRVERFSIIKINKQASRLKREDENMEHILVPFGLLFIGDFLSLKLKIAKNALKGSLS